MRAGKKVRLMEQNICHFIPVQRNYYSLQTVHFVLETKEQPFQPLKTESLYKVHYVRSGGGILHTLGREQPLKKGDLFFTFPGNPFSIESNKDFSYLYISFLGARGNQLLEMAGISKKQFYFENSEELEPFWINGLTAHPEMVPLISESILLYTFSHLGSKNLAAPKRQREENPAAMQIKKYIDDSFNDPALSLERIADALSYHPKYISTVFKKAFGVGFADYLNTIRIQHACTLIKQGFTAINDIAFCCGYEDPQYFSKVFKKKQLQSPRDYIKEQ